MKKDVECLNCGCEFEVDKGEIFEDELGEYIVCSNCGSSSDV